MIGGTAMSAPGNPRGNRHAFAPDKVPWPRLDQAPPAHAAPTPAAGGR